MKFGKRNAKPEDKEDNVVIADMNVEGMPWYRPDKSNEEVRDEKLPLPELDKKTLIKITLSATLAGLLIGLVFIFIFYLFVMFCVNVWLK